MFSLVLVALRVSLACYLRVGLQGIGASLAPVNPYPNQEQLPPTSGSPSVQNDAQHFATVQAHGEKLMRKEIEGATSHVAFSVTGTLSALRAASGAGTFTTTLSSMSSTTVRGLVPPAVMDVISPGTSLSRALTRTSHAPAGIATSGQDTGDNAEFISQASVKDARSQIVHHEGADYSPYPPNDQAAFEVRDAGLNHFNGVYMPSTTKYDSSGCTTFTWEFINANVLHSLYSKKTPDGIDTWCLQEGGMASPTYEGTAQFGRCGPENIADTNWATIAANGGAAPTISRLLANDFTTTVTTTSTAAGPSLPPGLDTVREYFVVSGAGIEGFNGVYSRTNVEEGNQKCKIIYGKNGEKDYILRFGSPMWYFESFVGGVAQQPYFGQDTNDCHPEFVNPWRATQNAFLPVPIVVETRTSTSTTTTTTSTTLSTTSATSTISTTSTTSTSQ